MARPSNEPNSESGAGEEAGPGLDPGVPTYRDRPQEILRGEPLPRGEPVSTPRGDGKPCCCSITLYGRVRVTELTDAGSIPGVSDLFGLFADHVFIRVQDCKGGQVKYPNDTRGIEVTEGGATAQFKFAEIEPSGNDCRLKCEIKILVHKDSKFNRILDRMREIERELAAAFAEYNGIVNQLGGINPLALTGIDPASLLARLAANKQRVDKLTEELNELAKELFGTADTLMLDERIDVSGYAPCNGDKWADALKPHPWTIDPRDPNRATLTLSSGERLGGKWELDLLAIRECPPH